MKELEGKRVWLRPSGNNARRSGEIIEATITKVGRVYATFEKHFEGRSYEVQKHRIQGTYLDNGHNGGYWVFATKEQLDDALFVERLAATIADKYSYPRHYARLDRATITKVAELLGVEIKKEAQ